MRALSYAPGTDALRKITPLLLQAQELTATALGHLTALDNSAYTSLTGSRAGLEALSATVAGVSLACTDLAEALSANPYEGAPFDGHPADDAQVRAARHAEAIPRMNSHLKDAALQLDVGATACHYLATSITNCLPTAAPYQPHAARHQAVPRLNDTQHAALKALAQGGRAALRGARRGWSASSSRTVRASPSPPSGPWPSAAWSPRKPASPCSWAARSQSPSRDSAPWTSTALLLWPPWRQRPRPRHP